MGRESDILSAESDGQIVMNYSAVMVGISGLLTALAAPACAGQGRFIQHGMDAYARGDFQGAEAEFSSLEPDISDMNPKGYVRYEIYRGLNLIELGNMEQGCAHLRRGNEALHRGESRWIPDNVQATLVTRLATCGIAP